MKRLICLILGHRPNDVLSSSYLKIADSYLTCCTRCGRVYEEPIRRGLEKV